MAARGLLLRRACSPKLLPESIVKTLMKFVCSIRFINWAEIRWILSSYVNCSSFFVIKRRKWIMRTNVTISFCYFISKIGNFWNGISSKLLIFGYSSAIYSRNPWIRIISRSLISEIIILLAAVAQLRTNSKTELYPLIRLLVS